MLDGPGEFGQGVGLDAGVFGEDGGRGRGRGEADDLPAVFGPGQGEGSHRGGLPGAGRRDRQLTRAPEVHICADQGCLPGIKRGAVRRHFQQRQLHGGCVDSRPIVSAGGGEDALFGVEDPLGGVAVGAGDGVDRRPVGPPQLVRFLDPVRRRFEGDRSVVQDFETRRSTSALGLLGRQVDGADLALGFGADVPHLPGRPACLQHRHDPVSGLADPAGIGHARRSLRAGASAVGDHRRDGVAAAEDRSSFGQPGGALLGVASGVRAWRRGSPRWPAGPGARASTAVGGRPWSAWNWTASSPRRALIRARRLDQRWFSRGSTPTISRIGRFAGSVPGRSANRTPRRRGDAVRGRCCRSPMPPPSP